MTVLHRLVGKGVIGNCAQEPLELFREISKVSDFTTQSGIFVADLTSCEEYR